MTFEISDEIDDGIKKRKIVSYLLSAGIGVLIGAFVGKAAARKQTRNEKQEGD